MALKHIQRDFKKLLDDPVPGTSAGPEVETNMLDWKAIVLGPEGTPYEGGLFNVSIKLGPDYPFKRAKVLITTKIYHPAVNDAGCSCLGEHMDEGSQVNTVRQALIAVRNLLMHPDRYFANNPDVDAQYKADRTAFDATARDWTRRYAAE